MGEGSGRTGGAVTLASRLTGQQAVTGPRCLVRYWIEEADDPETREAIQRAVGFTTDRKWSADALATELTGAGMAVSASTIRTHRRHQCACYRQGVDL